jgi:rubredoxin
MADDFFERLAALLPADALQDYAEIKDAMAIRHHELRQLDQQLVEIARRYGVPDIDAPESATTESIRASLNASSIEINSVWAAAPSEWRCPCCRRGKSACGRLGTQSQMLGKLVAHHDHIEDHLEVILGELSKEITIQAASAGDASRFLTRGSDFFTRFERIVICEDCNNAEANAKVIVGAERFFTFTPREIASFITTSPNVVHGINSTALRATYAAALPHYERRIASIRKLAEQALRGTAWYEPVAVEDREDHIERRGQRALELFGLMNVGYGTLREVLLPSRRIDAKHASTWRCKEIPLSRPATESELEFVIRGNAQFNKLPVDWNCPCCTRGKRDVIRWSQNSRQYIFSVRSRSLPDTSARYGKRNVVLCDACNHVFAEFCKEFKTAIGGQSGPDCLVGIDDISGIIRPQPYSLHAIDGSAAQSLLDTLISSLTRR